MEHVKAHSKGKEKAKDFQVCHPSVEIS